MCAAVAIVTSSKTPQPRHCRMFSTVGRYDSRAPNSPRSSTMAGAPVCAPGSPASATAPCRAACPPRSRSARRPGDSSGVPAPPGCSTKIAPVKPSRLTPRLPHSPNWSSRLSACGTGSASVRATSDRAVARDGDEGLVAGGGRHGSLPTPALPGQVQTVGGAGQRPATLSARSARAPVRVQFAWMLPAVRFGHHVGPANEPGAGLRGVSVYLCGTLKSLHWGWAGPAGGRGGASRGLARLRLGLRSIRG